MSERLVLSQTGGQPRNVQNRLCRLLRCATDVFAQARTSLESLLRSSALPFRQLNNLQMGAGISQNKREATLIHNLGRRFLDFVIADRAVLLGARFARTNRRVLSQF